MTFINRILSLKDFIVKKIILKIGNNKTIVNYWKDKGVNIGDDTVIYGNVNFGSEPYLITIGDNVKITSNVNFITHDGGLHVLRNLTNNRDMDYFSPITIGNNVFIGYNSIIMPGVTIGDNVILGAGSIVTKNIEENSVSAGVPAKKIKSMEEYYKEKKDTIFSTKEFDSKKKKKILLDRFKDK